MEDAVARIRKLLNLEVLVLEYASAPFLLFVRLYWGYAFAMSGWGKLHSLPDVTAFFVQLHIPAPGANALLVALTELIGGVLLFFGIGGRVFTIPLVICMSVAFLTSDFGGLQSLWLSSAACEATDGCQAFESTAAFSYWMAACIVLLFGAGPLSVDGLIRLAFPDPEKKPAA